MILFILMLDRFRNVMTMFAIIIIKEVDILLVLKAQSLYASSVPKYRKLYNQLLLSLINLFITFNIEQLFFKEKTSIELK